MFIAAFCVKIMSGRNCWQLAVVSVRHQTVTSSSRILYQYDGAIICVYLLHSVISINYNYLLGQSVKSTNDSSQLRDSFNFVLFLIVPKVLSLPAHRLSILF